MYIIIEVTARQVQEKMRYYIRKAEPNPKSKLHSLRHTFASWLVQRGLSIYEVSKLLGHADIKTIQICAHLRSDGLTNAVDPIFLDLIIF